METYTLKAENRSDSLSVEERTFEDIYNYNFQDNERFIEGWRKVRDAIPKEKLDESLIRAEVYFYSREVSPVDLIGYRKWLKDKSREIPNLEDLLSANKAVTDDKNKEFECQLVLENKNTNTVNDTHDKLKCSDSEKTEEDIIAKHPANFIELIEMIQSGMKLPDTEDLNIQPLNVEPTPCHVQSPKKPWEVT